MSESLKYIPLKASMASLLSLAAFNTSTLSIEHEPIKQPSISRCYDKPQLPQKSLSSKNQELSLPVINERVKGDPIYSTSIARLVSKSIVYVDTGNWGGTGFIEEDRYGEKVVVTAAHVVENTSLDDISITTNDGETRQPDGGCYIFENNGRFNFLNPKDDSYSDTDIAILTLPPESFNNPSLNLAANEARRGDWTYFVNYQENHEPGNPAIYTGLVSSEPRLHQGLKVITGTHTLNYPITQKEIYESTLQAGASGGPVVNEAGQVIGMSTAGDADGIYEDAQSLKYSYNIKFPGARYGLERGQGFIPNMAIVMSVMLIKKALNSPELDVSHSLIDSIGRVVNG